MNQTLTAPNMFVSARFQDDSRIISPSPSLLFLPLSLPPSLSLQINPGGDIPEEYYLLKLMENDKENMEKVVVGRGSTHLIPFQVATPGSILK